MATTRLSFPGRRCTVVCSSFALSSLLLAAAAVLLVLLLLPRLSHPTHFVAILDDTGDNGGNWIARGALLLPSLFSSSSGCWRRRYPTTATAAHAAANYTRYDVIVYGATPGGIAAAISASETLRRRRWHRNKSGGGGGSVLLIEPTSHVGGMATEGGIGLRDRKDWSSSSSASSNSLLRKNLRSSQYRWARLNALHYGLVRSKTNASTAMDEEEALIWQPDHYVGERSFLKLLKRVGVELMLNTDKVEGRGGLRIDICSPSRIRAVRLEDGSEVLADYFVDASYDGELLLSAEGIVDATFGREPSSQYSEKWGGVTNHSYARFPFPIDPFVDTPEGNMSELIPYVWYGKDPTSEVGEADDNLMAYSYRVCLTKDPNLAVPVAPPEGYDPKDFELARRHVLSQLAHNASLVEPWFHYEYMNYDKIPNKSNISMKYDACCGFSPVGIEAVGLGRGYANASRASRRRIAQDIFYYVTGLLWFWRTDPSVPEDVRKQHLAFGLCGDEWADNGHWPRQLYVREASRLVGDKVFTQNDRRRGFCRNDSIAVGQWGFDVHDMQRIAYWNTEDSTWKVTNEGLRGYDEQGGDFPYEIPYYVILPKRKQMANLAVVNCPSVSHVAFSSIRVEPILWTLGQAAGTAAAIAAMSSRPAQSLHDVDIVQLQAELVKQGIVIHWPPKKHCADVAVSSDTQATA